VCDGCPGSQCGGDHRGFGYLCVGCTCLARVTSMDIDAIWALSGERNSDGYQLLVLYRNCSIGDGRLVKCPKAFTTCGARPSILFNLAKFALLYIYG